MMKLFLKILSSLVLALAGLFLLELFVRFGLSNNKNFKISYIQTQRIDADMLAHGSCENEKMLDPSIVEQYIPLNVYNLALNHSDFADNYIFLYEYLKHQKKPKSVLIFAIPESFDSTKTNVFNTYRFAHLIKDPVVKEVVEEMDTNYARISCVPFIQYSFYSNFIFYKALDGWFRLLKGDTSTSWPTGYDAPVFSFQKPEKIRDEDRKSVFFYWSKKREKYFIKTIELLQQEGIKVIVYNSPIYYEALTLQSNRQDMINKIDSICRQYQVSYFRFDTLSMRYDAKNYYNSSPSTFPGYNTTLAGNAIFNNYFGKFLQDTLPKILGEHPKAKNESLKSDTNK